VFDGDSAGKAYVRRILKHNFDKAEVLRRCYCLSAGDLEDQLLQDGFEPELRAILIKLGCSNANSIDLLTLKKRLQDYKTAYAAELAFQIETAQTAANRMPALFRNAIGALSQLI